MLKSLSIIFLFLVVGEFVTYVFKIPIAGNIIGMVLIFLALKFKMIPLEMVKPASDKLLKYLVLFFVPYGVGLMVHFETIKEHWLSIGLAVLGSTILTLYLTAFLQEKLEKK
ncbi:CidA/LrgA family protein [Flagellimonas sp.]|uniref:CidA/LrgA family protein n=1 Tax=Flagellimonas sp. TaxID=2058762 RepID=UPI003BAB49E8